MSNGLGSEMSDFMRRLAPALAVGGSAMALVALFDPGFRSLIGDSAPRAAAKPAKVAAGSDGTTSTAPKPTASSGSGSSSAPTQQADSCASAKEVTGPAVDTPFGPIQVAAKVAGGKVCSAQAVEYPSNDGRSQRINEYAIPILNEEAVSQGANVAAVSGASYTSAGYQQSLQSLLASAG